MADDPDPRSVANHEASHAVAWWWWVNRPDGDDDGSGGQFEDLRLTIGGRAQHGGFNPGFHAGYTAEMPEIVDHHCIGLLAGPVSDEMRGDDPYHNKTDVEWAEKIYSDGMGHEMSASERERLRKTTRAFLRRPEVQAMVGALTAVLLEHDHVGYLDAVAAMERALETT